MNKCEWKYNGKDFMPCMGMIKIISKDISEKGYFVLSDYEKCPECGALTKPEPEVIIKKSGKTWVARFEGVDYLCICPKYCEDPTKRGGMLLGDIQQSVRFLPITEIEITDEIAKLRPMVISGSKKTGMLIGSNMGLNKNCYVIDFLDYDESEIKYSHFARLATVNDL